MPGSDKTNSATLLHKFLNYANFQSWARIWIGQVWHVRNLCIFLPSLNTARTCSLISITDNFLTLTSHDNQWTLSRSWQAAYDHTCGFQAKTHQQEFMALWLPDLTWCPSLIGSQHKAGLSTSPAKSFTDMASYLQCQHQIKLQIRQTTMIDLFQSRGHS